MSPTVVFLHTICGLKGAFDDLLAEARREGGQDAPVRTVHVADETLIRSILAAGGLTPYVRHRLRDHVLAAERFGASVVQMTCSSITPCVEELADETSVPLLSIDEPMAADAAARFNRVGVIATNPGTLTPSAELLRRQAERRGRNVSVEAVLCEGAYEALLAGDPAKHDEIVKASLLGLMDRSDAVVLAQASMTRIVETLSPQERRTPILSSPRPAMRRLAEVLEGIS